MKLWGGRFTRKTSSLLDNFNASIDVDYKLYKHDIAGSIAHTKMLVKSNIIKAEEGSKIISGLKSILDDIENNQIEFQIELEDIHMNIEKILTDRIGEVGKKLHTARSRNDQVAVDVRLYLRDEINEICSMIKDLLASLVDISESNLDTIMPGYTHLQRAQPITLAYHMMAYFQMFKRDYNRLMDCHKRVNTMPLGAGALAGTNYNTDREFLCHELGFDSICENSLDAVSDRDFVIEFLSDASLIMMHLSRFCEEIIIWNTTEFGFVEMDDAYSTGSSIMPQKKNPDIAELIRGKTGRVYGNLFNILTIMKGLPLAYNKDMQEDKAPLFDSVESVKNCIIIFNEMIKTMKFNKDKMYKATAEGFMVATDIADYLTKKGLPFRDSHEVVGKMVLYCITNKVAPHDLPLEKLQEFSSIFTNDIYEIIAVENSVNGKKSYGSTSNNSVARSIVNAKSYLNNLM